MSLSASSSLHRRVGLALLLCVAAATSIIPGCGNPQAAIDRVQPYALEKAVFAGEWYMQQTVIDTPYSVGFTFVGEQGGLERIRWEIQEDYLVARRSYQFIADSEPTGIGGAGDETGAAIAMYRIESHFDIRRDYNPVTGEELNVIVENSTDRPWYERRFMRVDWSTNLISETDLFALHRIIDGVSAEPVAYYVQDPTDPNAPQFVHDPSDGSVQYIDIVNQMFVRPEEVYIPEWGASIPSCFLLYQDHLDCTASQITIRNSFLRVDPSHDTQYQPLVYTGDRMTRFGYFNTLRAGYDEQYGVVEGARFHFVDRHNLWLASHRTNTTDGSLIACTADTDCYSATAMTGVQGSVCDLDFARAHRTLDANGHLSGACTIPYVQRQTQPIVYYTSTNFPEDLIPDAQAFASDWNSAFVDTVASLRENECLAGGGAAADCAMQRTRETDLFVLCQSPVPHGAPAACGPEGTEARPGDLRYSLVGWVNEPFLASPLGYGPSSADPITGEIIMGNAFVYGAGVETLESYARDLIRLLNGDVDFNAVENGAVVQAWLNHEIATPSTAIGPTDSSHAVPLDPAHMEAITGGMDFGWARGIRPEEQRTPPHSFQAFMAERQASQDRLYNGGGFGNTITATRPSRIIGTDIEAALTTPEMLMAAGMDPATPLTGDVIAAASPLQGMSANRLASLRQLRDQIQTHGCVLDAQFAEDGLTGLAHQIVQAANTGDGTITWYGVPYQLRDANGHLDYDLVRTMLRHPIFEAVTAHEVGHTLGLRHNFSGSFDALNYAPTYWDLRSHSDDGTMAPRLWDPESPSETAGRIREYQYSTVMDYGENFVSTDAQRIGHYDRAAIKMGYGDMVEVFTDAASPDEVAFWSAIQDLGWPVAVTADGFNTGTAAAYQYTDWPQVVGGGDVTRIQHRADVPYTSIRPQAFVRMQGIDGNYADAQGRPVVPYMFCSDEQADLGPDCLRYDAGSDAYESLQSIADTYWNYYIFTNFRRQRLGFTPEGVVSRVHDRWFEKLQNGNDIYVLNRALFEDVFGATLPADFYTGQHAMGAWSAASATAYGLLTRVVSAPTPGNYARHLAADGTEIYMIDNNAMGAGAHAVNAFDGRYIDTTWNFDDGYYWFDQIQRVGYFYDKVIALSVLTDPTTHFIGRDTDADIRRYQINFASVYGPAMTSFFRGAMGEDWRAVAPRFDGTGNLAYPLPADQATGGPSGTPVDPDIGFSIELYATVLGMIYIPQTYDQDFLNRSRIWVTGGNEEVTIDPSHTLVQFTDPVSGLEYNAVSYPDTGGRETGVGAQLLIHAQQLDTHNQDATLRRFIDNIDIVRRMTALLGGGAQP